MYSTWNLLLFLKRMNNIRSLSKIPLKSSFESRFATGFWWMGACVHNLREPGNNQRGRCLRKKPRYTEKNFGVPAGRVTFIAVLPPCPFHWWENRGSEGQSNSKAEVLTLTEIHSVPEKLLIWLCPVNIPHKRKATSK